MFTNSSGVVVVEVCVTTLVVVCGFRRGLVEIGNCERSFVGLECLGYDV